MDSRDTWLLHEHTYFKTYLVFMVHFDENSLPLVCCDCISSQVGLFLFPQVEIKAIPIPKWAFG